MQNDGNKGTLRLFSLPPPLPPIHPAKTEPKNVVKPKKKGFLVLQLSYMLFDQKSQVHPVPGAARGDRKTDQQQTNRRTSQLIDPRLIQ